MKNVDEIIMVIEGVGGGDTDFPLSLVRNAEDGRIVLRGVNDGGFACVDIDFCDLLLWLARVCPGGINVDAISTAVGAR